MLKEKMFKESIDESSRLYIHLSVLGTVVSIFIISFILFYPPMPGVADQGDFQRVMSVTGLEEYKNYTNDDESRWFKYVTTEYKMIPISFNRIVGIMPTTSMIYPIYAARLISNVLGDSLFNTRYLAIVYAVIYILGLYICLRGIRFKRRITAGLFSLLSIFILLDGNYIIWFNSLYGEPMMIVGLLLFIGAFIYASKNIADIGTKEVLFLFISALLFLGSKMQCFVALPIVIFMILRITIFQKSKNGISRRLILTVPILMLVFNVGGIYSQVNSNCGVDTEFNSVFYGVLKSSEDPERDLKALGLSTDMSVEAGKHAYLPKEKYVKYVPWSKLTLTEFNEKVSNKKLLIFYLSQPGRLIRGMEYTASRVFDTQGSLGKYEKSAVTDYTYAFNRFTLWSDFRSTKLPRKLAFLIPFYIIVAVISIKEYLERKGKKTEQLRIELLWSVIAIGALQFPMPYIGNGEADTAKQLFLFNYTFDIVFLISCVWIFDKMCMGCKRWITRF